MEGATSCAVSAPDAPPQGDRFRVDDDRWRAHLEEHGYVVIEQVVESAA